MKAETIFASLAMALFGVLFVVAAANAMAPPKKGPEQPKASAAAPAPVAPVNNAVIGPTHTPEEAAAIANLPQDAKARDARRLSDLRALQDALKTYKDKKGNYPSTGGGIQSACVYEKLDKLCDIKSQVSADKFVDPRGNTFGYFYSSSGKTYAIYAFLEGDNAGSEPCPGDISIFKTKQNLYCVTSGPPD
jgi:hypothetical protein